MKQLLKGVVLAAGIGKRLRPITETRPKALVPILGKKLIEYPMNFLKLFGLEEIVVVVGYMAECVEAELTKLCEELNLHCVFTKQEQELGTGHALKIALKKVGGEDVVLVYGDLFLDPAASRKLRQVVDKVKSRDMVVGVIKVDDVSRYAYVKVVNGVVKELVEKPKVRQPGYANAGVYFIPSKHLELVEQLEISPRGEYELTDLVVNAVRRNERVYTFELEQDEWMDVGLPWLIIEANKLALNKWGKKLILGDVEPTATIKGPVIIEENARVRGSTYIMGPAYIGRDADVGPNSFIRPYTVICEGARIGFSVEVKESVVFEDVHAAHLAYIGDSVVAEHVNLGAGTKLANLRFDGKNVKVTIEGKRIDSGRRKLGAIIGGYVKTGINVSIMPGVRIGSYSIIYPGVTVYRDVPSRTVVKHDWV